METLSVPPVANPLSQFDKRRPPLWPFSVIDQSSVNYADFAVCAPQRVFQK
jgi:hypothetical protein